MAVRPDLCRVACVCSRWRTAWRTKSFVLCPLVGVGPLCPVVFLFGGARVFSVDACGRALSLLVVRSHRSSSPSGRSRRYVQAGCALRSLRPLEFCVCPLSRRAVWRVRAFGARCVRFVPLRGCRVRAGRVRRGSFGSIACVWFSAFSGSAWNREFCVFVWFRVAPGGARAARVGASGPLSFGVRGGRGSGAGRGWGGAAAHQLPGGPNRLFCAHLGGFRAQPPPQLKPLPPVPPLPPVMFELVAVSGGGDGVGGYVFCRGAGLFGSSCVC